MIKFGPSGNSENFYNEGYTSTMEMPKWLNEKGLNIFEYSFGRGVMISSKTAAELGVVAKEYGIELSVHAPYYINFASQDDILLQKSYGYILTSLKILKAMGGKRCVFHCGSPQKQNREEAMNSVYNNIIEMVRMVKENGYEDFLICPETMGKINQLGTVDEIIRLCNIDDIVIPCVDFGHVNARENGILHSYEDFKKVIDKFRNGIGVEKTNNMHIHFSHIQYSAKGEIRHLNFDDIIYGPFFEPLCDVLIDYNMTPCVLCESAGNQAEDALSMRNIYLEKIKKVNINE